MIDSEKIARCLPGRPANDAVDGRRAAFHRARSASILVHECHRLDSGARREFERQK
jgi:hypothetical protein